MLLVTSTTTDHISKAKPSLPKKNAENAWGRDHRFEIDISQCTVWMKTLASPPQLTLPLCVPLRRLKCSKATEGRIPLIFGKVPRGGGGVIFNPKIYVADFGDFKQGL